MTFSGALKTSCALGNTKRASYGVILTNPCWSNVDEASGGLDLDRLVGLQSIDIRDLDRLIARQSIAATLENSFNLVLVGP